jgi:hypothetical protein
LIAGGCVIASLRGRTSKSGAELGVPGGEAEGSDVFLADAGEGLQKKLGEIAEGYGVFAANAALGEEEKDAGECGVDAGGGGEAGAEGLEFGQESGIGGIGVIEGSAAGAVFGGVIGAETGALVAALAAVGEGESATIGRG